MPQERRASIKIRVEDADYEVTGGDFQTLLAAVKALPDRKFDSGSKMWIVSSSLALVRGQLENSGLTLEGGTAAEKPARSSAPAAEKPARPATPAERIDRIKVTMAEGQWVVTGDSFQAMLAVIKEIPGRRFDGQTKQWNLPGTAAEIKAFLEKRSLRLESGAGGATEAPPPVAPPVASPVLPPEPDLPPFPDEAPSYFDEEDDSFF